MAKRFWYTSLDSFEILGLSAVTFTPLLSLQGMPAVRTPKKATSTSKAKPESQKKTVNNPGIQKRRKEWREQLPQPWKLDLKFKHPQYTTTVATKAAKADYHLTDEELRTLPHETRPSGYLKPMKLYSHEALFNLARDKSKFLQSPLIIGNQEYLSDPGPAGSAVPALVQLRNLKLPKWMDDLHDPQPPPLKQLDYQPVTTGERPDPPIIRWMPSDVPEVVSVSDACRLYCIEPGDLEDLATASHWIDVGTVARRAVKLHGGFYAHHDYVQKRREQEEKMLENKYRDSHDFDQRSDFEWSPHVRAYRKWCAEDDTAWMYEIPGKRDTEKRVAVLYPISYEHRNDFGPGDWEPYWGHF
ncbi:hypothetical protein C8F01DRAFT_1116017 [Mycena amicta]|nr:hypothetical protein C8F01DRAFT_1116017 [Mycena amicta]